MNIRFNININEITNPNLIENNGVDEDEINNIDKIYPMAYEENKERLMEESLRNHLNKFYIDLEDLKELINIKINENFILFLIREIYKIIYFLKNNNEIYIDFNLNNILFKKKKYFDIRLSKYKNKINKNDYNIRKNEIIENFKSHYKLKLNNDTIKNFEDLKHLQNYSLGINIKKIIEITGNDCSKGLKTFVEKLIRTENGNLNTEFDEEILKKTNEYDFDKIIKINQFNFFADDLIFIIKQINNLKKFDLRRRKKFKFLKDENYSYNMK